MVDKHDVKNFKFNMSTVCYSAAADDAQEHIYSTVVFQLLMESHFWLMSL